MLAHCWPYQRSSWSLSVVFCRVVHFGVTQCATKKININMALVIVTSVPNRFLMIGPFLLSMLDQWYIVMAEHCF